MVNHEEEVDLEKYLKKLLFFQRMDQVVIRGCVTGIFTAVGATVGFFFVLYAALGLVGSLRQVPFLDTILAQTKLDVLIENQVNKLTSEEENTPEPTEETKIVYADPRVNLSFKYPDIYSAPEKTEGQRIDTYSLKMTTDKGPVTELRAYVNQEITLRGNRIQTTVTTEDQLRITMYIYEQGAEVSDETFTSAVFYAQVKTETDTFNFIGIADANTPKLGREVFASILESADFALEVETN